MDWYLFGISKKIALAFGLYHGLIKDTKTKCRYLKILTLKTTLRQVFARVYRLETQSAVHLGRQPC